MVEERERVLKVSDRRVRLVIAAIILILLVAGLVWGLRGQGLRSKARTLVDISRAVLDSSSMAKSGDFTDVIFLHHSTGRNLIAQGGVRERLTEAGFRFWDHDYNHEGLIRPDSTRTGYSYNIPDDNTNPDGLAQVFSQHLYSKPLNAFSGLMQHEVIVFKSCFPVSHITSDAQLEQYKAYYLQMREVMTQYPDRVFVVVTPPPLNPAGTDVEAAARARAFSAWLKSDEFLAGQPNIFTFDFFDLLAEGDAKATDANMLRSAYREGQDSHPNRLANETIGPVFAEFIVKAVHEYRAKVAR